MQKIEPMIRLSLKDKKLEANPEVRKWLDKCEEVMNGVSMENMITLRDDYAYCVLVGLPFLMDEYGKIVPPEKLYKPGQVIFKDI